MNLGGDHINKLYQIYAQVEILKSDQTKREAQQFVQNYQQRFTELQNDSEHNQEYQVKIQKRSINKSLVNTGKITKVKPQQKEDQDHCVVCLQPYQANQLKRQLNCGHQFHKKCIDKWLYPKYHDDQELLCPLCCQDLEKLSKTAEKIKI